MSVATVPRARDLRRAMTDAERRLWARLRAGQAGVRFCRQQPIGPFIVDFYCAAAALVVEVDGGQHGGAADAARDAWLAAEGFEVARYWNHDVLARTDAVLADILRRVAQRRRPLTPALFPGGERGRKARRGRIALHDGAVGAAVAPSPLGGEGRGEGGRR